MKPFESSSSDSWIASKEAEQFDIALAELDCVATQAHVLMLHKQSIISSGDAAQALEALLNIETVCKNGQFRYSPGLGAQLTLEKMVIDIAGENVGYQVHTGRSRNDQVLTAQKLYVRNRIIDLSESLEKLINALLSVIQENISVIMPGYTHMQPARPTTVGQWLAAYTDMLLGDAQRIRSAYERNNSSPLGAAESHGTSWSLDREYTRDLLGFQDIDEIPLYAISARGESDLDFLTAISFVSLHLSKLAQDLLLFTTFEYGYMELGSSQATRMGKLTGSSIMPQKRNPDVLELLRSQASSVYSDLLHNLETLKALPTGYNRDSRDTKEPIIKSLGLVEPAICQAVQVIRDLNLNEEKMRSAIDKNYSMATDLAEYLSQKYNTPFRKMHQIVGEVVAEAIKDGRNIGDIMPSEIASSASKINIDLAPSKKDLEIGTSPEMALERRDNIGGSSKKQMNKWIQSRQRQAKDFSSWREESSAAISKSRKTIRRLASEIIKSTNNDSN